MRGASLPHPLVSNALFSASVAFFLPALLADDQTVAMSSGLIGLGVLKGAFAPSGLTLWDAQQVLEDLGLAWHGLGWSLFHLHVLGSFLLLASSSPVDGPAFFAPIHFPCLLRWACRGRLPAGVPAGVSAASASVRVGESAWYGASVTAFSVHLRAASGPPPRPW